VKGKPTSDPLKTAQADILELNNGLCTLEEKLAERGLDFEEVIAQRKSEKEQLEAAGLPYPVPKEQVGLMDTSADDEALSRGCFALASERAGSRATVRTMRTGTLKRLTFWATRSTRVALC
jgi:hypothetical protein